jgi:hypothetical protein
MSLSETFADVDTARAMARSLYPDANAITMIEHSADNIVALVDTSYALRFHRSKDAYLRSLYEKYVLRQLEGVQTLTIPRILGEHASPPCVITSFVRLDIILVQLLSGRFHKKTSKPSRSR